ncbi:MAG: beta-lactamase family protein [Phycisphaerae bacterium]|nr:beta-lactamase family protein [Phycisphaerae bacterium]
MRMIVLLACCSLLLITLNACIRDAPYKIAGPNMPLQLNDGWEVAAPEDVGISRQSLDSIYTQFIAEDRFFNAKSLLVVKDGKLVFETYCRDLQDRDRYSNIQSVTKSVTSLVFGIIYSEHYVDSLSQTLYSILPDKFPSDGSKRTITMRDLFTMRSGILFDNDVFSVEIYTDESRDPVKYILNKPMYAEPGEEFYYRDCDPHLLSYAITRLTGRSEEVWARERLFAPLGIEDYYWDSDHFGTSMGAHGLHLRPRDLAKIGQMVLNNGVWRGRQIVDSAWIAESTRQQTTTSYQVAPDIRGYGYYWWVLPRWDAIEAWGHGGNSILIVPNQALVIVMTSMPHTDNDVVGTRSEQFHELVSPLIGGS